MMMLRLTSCRKQQTRPQQVSLGSLATSNQRALLFCVNVSSDSFVHRVGTSEHFLEGLLLLLLLRELPSR